MGGVRAPGQGNAAIAVAEPRWFPLRAFGATAPPLTEGTGGARRPVVSRTLALGASRIGGNYFLSPRIVSKI